MDDAALPLDRTARDGRFRAFALAGIIAFAVWSGVPASAQDGNLAQQAQNPIANLISVPFQNNTNFNVGPFGETQNILNIQPVIPFKLNAEWNLVTRWILPVVYQPSLHEGDRSDFGLGNFNPTFFLVKQLSPTVMLGAGPIFLLPTSTVSAPTNGAPGLPRQSCGRRASG